MAGNEMATPAPGEAIVVDRSKLITADALGDHRSTAPFRVPRNHPGTLVLRRTDAELATAPINEASDSDVDPGQSYAATNPRPAPSAGGPTGAVVNQRATVRIRRGYELADRGAYFAARNEFVDALNIIAEAKDQLHGTPRRTVALANGLRALDEAADFLPLKADGAEVSLAVIVASHRTPAAKAIDVRDMLPQQLAESVF